jgi:thiamine transport system ATP-binding protein
VLDVRDLTVRYGEVTAVRGLDLHAADGEVLCLLGPSGCGKSTVLRAIAGLETPVTGSVAIDGRDVAGLRADQREVGLMFQDHALFPHRTVAENVAFGPRMRGDDRVAVRRRVNEVLGLVDLRGLEERRVTELSGGEQQRVALARAIAPAPRLLMLDEPLGSLDRHLRDRLIGELARLFRELGTTVLYVTHDQDEALALADRVGVMRGGRLLQLDTPAALWRAPEHEFTARFLGNDHLLDGEVTGGTACTVLGDLSVPDASDGPIRLVLLPDALRLVDSRRPLLLDEVGIEGTVSGLRFAGDHLRVTVATGTGLTLVVPVWRGAAPEPGTRVEVALDPTAVRRVARDDGGG